MRRSFAYNGGVPQSKSSRILHRLIALGPATRGELGAELGMSSATVTRLVTPLIDKGVVSMLQGFGPDYIIGKPAYQLAIVPSYTSFVGVKITDTTSFAVLVDLNGTVLADSEVSLGDDVADDVMSVVAEQIQSMSTGLHIAGVGIGVGGRVHEGHVMASGILQWNDVDVAGCLQEILGVPVSVSNDVNAFAQAEAWWGAGRGYEDFVLMSVGSGIGSCIVHHGTVMSGAHGAAGMIGHLQITRHGPRCESGHIGCARAYASSVCMMRYLHEEFGIEESYEEFLHQAANREQPQQQVADAALNAMVRLVSYASAFIDPDAIIVSGEGVRLLEVFEQEFRNKLAAYKHWNSPNIDVKLQEMHFTFWAKGAAAASMEHWTQTSLTQSDASARTAKTSELLQH